MPPQPAEPPREVRGLRVQDAVLHIVGGCAAHGEEAVPVQQEDLPSHQVKDMGPDGLCPAAVPVFHRIPGQRVIVLMVPADEGHRERKALQPVQGRVIPGVSKPDAHKVAFILNSV